MFIREVLAKFPIDICVVKAVRLQDRLARAHLKPRHHPYWRSLAPGFHLDYYCGKRDGNWVARYRQPGSDESYMTERFGQADDLVQTDGRTVLSWSLAFEKAGAWVKRQPACRSKITAFDDQRSIERAGAVMGEGGLSGAGRAGEQQRPMRRNMRRAILCSFMVVPLGRAHAQSARGRRRQFDEVRSIEMRQRRSPPCRRVIIN